MGTAFADGFKSMNGNIQAMNANITEQAKKSALPPTDEPKDDPIIPEGKKVEDLTTEEIFAGVEKIVVKAVDERLKGTEKRLDDSELAAQRARMKSEVADVSKDNPLFARLQEQMKALITEDPNLSGNVKRLFAIAKDENREIVQEFEKAQEDAKKEGEKDGEHKFGGLIPGSSGGGEVDEEAGQLDLKEAALKAWDETMQNVPSGLIGGNA